LSVERGAYSSVGRATDF